MPTNVFLCVCKCAKLNCLHVCVCESLAQFCSILLVMLGKSEWLLQLADAAFDVAEPKKTNLCLFGTLQNAGQHGRRGRFIGNGPKNTLVLFCFGQICEQYARTTAKREATRPFCVRRTAVPFVYECESHARIVLLAFHSPPV